jgi:hypothetical protein
MTFYTSVIDFSDVDFSHAELFASVVGSIKRSVPESAEFDFDLTEGRTITLTFHTTSQRTAVLSLCRAYFEVLEDQTTLAIVREAKLETVHAGL